jgi:hypothetical protein
MLRDMARSRCFFYLCGQEIELVSGQDIRILGFGNGIAWIGLD